MFAHVRALHTHFCHVLLRGSLVLAHTMPLFSVMYFLICTDVIFVQLHQKQESDITDLIKYVATHNRGHAHDVSLVYIIQKCNGPSTHLPNAMSLL